MTQSDWFDDDSALQDMLLDEMGENVRALFEQLQGLDGGLLLLRFLNDQKSTLMTAEDIAFQLSIAPAAAHERLLALEELGLVQRVEVAGLTLFGLHTAEAPSQLVADLLRWQDLWHERLSRIENFVDGDSADRSPGPTTSRRHAGAETRKDGHDVGLSRRGIAGRRDY